MMILSIADFIPHFLYIGSILLAVYIFFFHTKGSKREKTTTLSPRSSKPVATSAPSASHSLSGKALSAATPFMAASLLHHFHKDESSSPSLSTAPTSPDSLYDEEADRRYNYEYEEGFEQGLEDSENGLYADMDEGDTENGYDNAWQDGYDDGFENQNADSDNNYDDSWDSEQDDF